MKKNVYLIMIVLVSACHSVPEPEFAKNPVVAHRGAWKNTGAPQNSFEAFEMALDREYGGTEFDVHMTADSVLVVNHDPTYFGMPVQESTYRELNATKLSNGEDLPLLYNFLERGVKQESTRLFLEIKPSERGPEWASATAAKVVGMVKSLKAEPWVIYISFDMAILKQVLRHDPGAKVMFLGGNIPPEAIYQDKLSGMAYHYSQYRFNEDWIAESRRLGMAVYAWTVNDPLEMIWLLNHMIRYIATDEPEILLDMYQRHL